MKRMKWFAVLAISCLAGCNDTLGQCWVDENGNGTADPGEPGAGNDPTVPPSGGGDNGEAPPREPQDATQPPPCEAILSYSASLFTFKTTLADDGKDEGGGYQEATAPIVKFIDTRQDPPEAWTCSVWVGMPVRTAGEGTISASRAADMAADVMTTTSSLTMHTRPVWIPALFCSQLGTDMTKVFKKIYPNVGGSAKAQ